MHKNQDPYKPLSSKNLTNLHKIDNKYTTEPKKTTLLTIIANISTKRRVHDFQQDKA